MLEHYIDRMCWLWARLDCAFCVLLLMRVCRAGSSSAGTRQSALHFRLFAVKIEKTFYLKAILFEKHLFI